MKLKQLYSSPYATVPVIVLAFLTVVVLLFNHARGVAYSKSEPYGIELTVEAAPQSTVFLSYDYGFGIRDQHIRRLVLGDEPTHFSLSVSAWKHVYALYVISPKDNPYVVKNLRLVKNGVEFQPVLPESGPTLEGDNWIYRLPLTDFVYR